MKISLLFLASLITVYCSTEDQYEGVRHLFQGSDSSSNSDEGLGRPYRKSSSDYSTEPSEDSGNESLPFSNKGMTGSTNSTEIEYTPGRGSTEPLTLGESFYNSSDSVTTEDESSTDGEIADPSSDKVTRLAENLKNNAKIEENSFDATTEDFTAEDNAKTEEEVPNNQKSQNVSGEVDQLAKNLENNTNIEEKDGNASDVTTDNTVAEEEAVLDVATEDKEKVDGSLNNQGSQKKGWNCNIQ